MRNVFQQYVQPENRLTHAIFSALHHDRRLLARFIKDVCNVVPPVKADKLSVSVQRLPYGGNLSEADAAARNIPDAWIFSDDGWALVFEAKISTGLRRAQLDGHRLVARKYGYENARFFTMVPPDSVAEVRGWTRLTWPTLFRWLRGQQASLPDGQGTWAGLAADYIEIVEDELSSADKATDIQLTTFSGFFLTSADYTYAAAKNRLRAAMRELRGNVRFANTLGMDPNAPGRGAITGNDSDFVWDFLGLKVAHGKKFNAFPHLTLEISRTSVDAMTTFPNALNAGSRRNLLSGGAARFTSLAADVLARMSESRDKTPDARPIMRVLQRRYPSQRACPIHDASLEFDLRTAVREGVGPKHQPQWIEALFAALAGKSSNLQFQIGMSFDYAKCPVMASAGALDRIVETWIGCNPMLKAALRAVE